MTEGREQDESQQLDEIRRVVSEGISFLQGEAFSDHLSALTFPSFLAEAISIIENDQSDIRPGKINGLRSLKGRMQAALDRALQLPGELFEVVSDDEEESSD